MRRERQFSVCQLFCLMFHPCSDWMTFLLLTLLLAFQGSRDQVRHLARFGVPAECLLGEDYGAIDVDLECPP